MWPFGKKMKDESLKVECLPTKVEIVDCCCVKEAKIVHIQGKGALKERAAYSSRDDDIGYCSQISLYGVPLAQYNGYGCPTCVGWLATGYGRETVTCEEVRQYSKYAEKPFENLESSIEGLNPILKLLESGLYAIGYGECFPTDGEENFFWNVSNELERKQGTAILPTDYGQYINGEPAYLYPTQGAKCYNPERVQYYKEMFQKTGKLPPILVYNFQSCLNIVLDGHHRACAAALLGIPVPCIMIFPFWGYSCTVKDGKREKRKLIFSGIEVDVGEIPKEYQPTDKTTLPEGTIKNGAGRLSTRQWEPEYLGSVKKYPTLQEYVNLKGAGLSFDTNIDILNQELEKYFAKYCPPSGEKAVVDDFDHLGNRDYPPSAQKAEGILTLLKYKDTKQFKKAAIRCIKHTRVKSLRETAYILLVDIKDDPEVEQVFIDYLIENEDRKDIFLPLIHSYWDR